MIEKFVEIENRFCDIERQISDPEVMSNMTLYQELLRTHSELEVGIEFYREYKKLEEELEEVSQMSGDPDMKDLLYQETKRLNTRIDEIKDRLMVYLIPPDPNDNKNAVFEIRSGTGGEEAALFAAELFRMYCRYAELNRWKVEVLSENITGLGGVKEVSFVIAGTGVFSRLKYESGTHRVQRVPDTETSGRVHTSAATVAILPEAEDVDIQIDMTDIRVDTYRAQGAGGQHVNKTSSAVRLTHMPSGVVVACQDERSQFQNKDKAMRLLRTKLYDATYAAQQKNEAEMRKSQVGSGDRSEKIRTYNYPQSRVTDHRINLTLYCLDDVLNGAKLGDIIDALVAADRLEKMKG